MKLQDIADKVGVSRSTVSRALRGDPRIPRITRKKIEQAAASLGYKKNPYISVLMSDISRGKLPRISPVIAFVSNHQEDSWLDNFSVMSAKAAAEKKANKYGFNLQYFLIDRQHPATDFKRIKKILQARGINAMILASFGEKSLCQSMDLELENFAAVTLGVQLDSPSLSSIITDYLWNTQIILKSMRERGYRRIGMAIVEPLMHEMQMMPRMAFLDYEITIPEEERVGIWMGEFEDLVDFAQWFKITRPDALITADSSPQIWLPMLGFRIPQDIGIAQLQPNFITYPLSGVDHWYRELGSYAVEQLMIQIQNNQFGIQEHSVHLHHRDKWNSGYSLIQANSKDGGRLFDDRRQRLIEIASYATDSRILRERQEILDTFQQETFKSCRDARDEEFTQIALGKFANAPFYTPFLFQIGGPLPLPLSTGSIKIRGIPFEIPEASKFEKSVIISLNPRSTIADKTYSFEKQSFIIPLNRKASAVYFLHQAFFVSNGKTAATYQIRLSDDTLVTKEIKPLFPPESSEAVAAIQDSYTAFPQFESEHAKPYLSISSKYPVRMDKYFYVYEFCNPHPELQIREIEIVNNPDSQATILITALTIRQAE